MDADDETVNEAADAEGEDQESGGCVPVTVARM